MHRAGGWGAADGIVADTSQFLGALSLALTVTLAYRLFLIWRSKPEHRDGDDTSHLMLVKEITRANYRIPKRFDRFVMNENSYPCGMHKIMAWTRLPQSFWERYGCYVPMVFNLLLLIWIGAVCYRAGGGTYAWLLLFPLTRICWDKTPALFLNERAYGAFGANVFLGANFLLVATGDWMWAIWSVMGLTMAASGSKFANQAMAFFSLLLSLLTLNPLYFLSWMAHVAVSILMTRGYVLHILKSQIAYSVFYKRHRTRRYLFTNHYRQLLDAFRPGRFVHGLFTNPILMTVTACPPLLAFLWIWSVGGWPYTDLAVYALCGIILCLLTATEPLKFLGRPERYLEFAILPAMLFLSQFPPEQFPGPFLASLALGLWAVVNHRAIPKSKKGKLYDNEAAAYHDLINFLEAQPDGLILPIPVKISHYLGYASERHRYLAPFLHQFDPAYVPDVFPYPGNRLQAYAEQYGADFVVLRKRALAKINRFAGGEYYDFSSFPIVYENESFVVYQPGG